MTKQTKEDVLANTINLIGTAIYDLDIRMRRQEHELSRLAENYSFTPNAGLSSLVAHIRANAHLVHQLNRTNSQLTHLLSKEES